MEYDEKGNIVYEVEYLNGIRLSGKIKEYFDNNKLLFEGVYKNVEKNGKVKAYNTNGI